MEEMHERSNSEADMSTEPRPNFSADIAKAAAKSVAGALLMEGLIESNEVSELADAIAKHGGRHMDGYQLAKRLDDHGWDCDLPMAEALDGWWSSINREIDKAQKAWAERNDIQPPLPVGTRVTTNCGEKGTIDAIYTYGAAQYCVAIDGETRSGARLIVNFEDVRELIGETSAP